MTRLRLFLIALFFLAGLSAGPVLADGCLSDVGDEACAGKARALCLNYSTCYWGTCVAVNATDQSTCSSRLQCLSNGAQSDALCKWNKELGTDRSATPSGGNCFCADDYKVITIENYTDAKMLKDLESSPGACKVIPASQCTPTDPANKKTSGASYSKCQSYPSTQDCSDGRDAWTRNKDAQLKAAAQGKKGSEVNSALSRFIPECALYDDGRLTDECKDVGIFVVLLINICRYLFSIIGGLALLMFIYGGFILIISQGNSELIEKGKSAMTAAVIGLVVAFSAYLLINFIGGVVGVSSDFLLK